jgi:UDP-N-acetylmuramate: L-alanyl-gamma-D-glutamyl-meso-diaminopimelate ligase
VIEADEYDTAFFDKRSKFVHYRPRTAILNNLEFDHADIFDDLAAIERQFHHLVRTVPASGRLVVNARDEALQRVLSMGCWSGVQRFGGRKEEPGMLRARGEPHAFDVLRGGLKVARVEWQLLGEHNQLNALAAIGAAEHAGVAPESRRARSAASATSGAASSCAARPAASPSTTTSRTTRPPCAPPSTACAARSAARASSPPSSRARTR